MCLETKEEGKYVCAMSAETLTFEVGGIPTETIVAMPNLYPDFDMALS